ncbi:unnamed protein product [Orchesella dallaii]|uniref:Odorant receptor n=1 Tax=Orchesella dallaii TaxID=48710 RepID=A0ABP1QDG7_9HEXA
MGFGEACLNVQVLFQKIFDTPIFYDISRNKLTQNPKLETRWKMAGWHIMVFGIIFLVIISLLHVRHLAIEVTSGRTVEAEEVLVACLTIVMFSQTLITTYTVERNPQYFTFISTQIFEFSGVKYQGWPSSRRLPDLQEVVGYYIALTLCDFTFVAIAYPFLRDHDIGNVLLKGVLPELPRRLLVMAYYGWYTFYTTNFNTQFLLLIITCCQIFEKETEMNLLLSTQQPFEKKTNWLEKLVQAEAKIFFGVCDKIWKRQTTVGVEVEPPQEIVVQPRNEEESSPTFRKILHRHNCLYILMASSNANVRVFIPGMAAVGMALCVVCNYIILTMYDKEYFQLFAAFGAIVLLCAGWLIAFFCHHASLPLIYTEATIQHWKQILSSNLARRKLRTMRTIGFTLGPFFMAKRGTALDMLNTIIDTTISVVLA